MLVIALTGYAKTLVYLPLLLASRNLALVKGLGACTELTCEYPSIGINCSFSAYLGHPLGVNHKMLWLKLSPKQPFVIYTHRVREV